MRGCAYLGFFAIAIVFWPCLFLYVALAMQHPLPLAWEHSLEIAIVGGSIPLTALAFVVYRSMIHRMIGADRNP